MAYNRTLVAGASVAIGLTGDAAPKIFSYLSFECQQAVSIQAQDAILRQACGPTFGEINLFVIIFIGVAAFLVLNFWQDIGSFIQEKLE